MRRLSIVLMVIFLCSLVCGCDSRNQLYVDGIENFKLTEGSYEINVHILPSEDFIVKFPYSTAKYNYKQLYKHHFSISATECSLIVIHYEATQYSIAKSYCLENMDLINNFEYNEYVFAENIRLAIEHGRVDNGKVTHSQEWFNMFGYSDTKCCLVFVGSHILDGIDDNTKTDATAWGEFLQTYFSEFYTF